MNPGIANLEYAHAIKEEKMEKPGHSVHSGRKLTSLCCQRKHINHCSNYQVEGSYLFV